MNVMKISQVGEKLIKHYESLHDGDLSVIGLQPKLCPAGIWTIGWGHAIVYNGKFLKSDKTGENKKIAYSLYPSLTVEEADRLFLVDVAPFENFVTAQKINLSQNQFDALVSFCYNCGNKNFLTSTLKKRIISKTGSIEEAFLMWNKGDVNGDGKLEVLAGLTARRRTEAELFTNGTLTFYN